MPTTSSLSSPSTSPSRAVPGGWRGRLRLDGPPPGRAPSPTRVVVAAAVSVAGSLAAVALLAALGAWLFSVPRAFDKFGFASYAPLTVLGIAGAVVAWVIVARLSSAPTWLLGRLAVVVTVLLLVPDLLLLPQADNPPGPVVTLMVMHVVIAVITYLAVVRVAPLRPGSDRSAS